MSTEGVSRLAFEFVAQKITHRAYILESDAHSILTNTDIKGADLSASKKHTLFPLQVYKSMATTENMNDIEEAGVTKIRLKTEKEFSEETLYFAKAVQQLVETLSGICKPPVEQVKNELFELTCKQEALLAQMRLENKKIHETFKDTDLNDMFAAIKVYQGKLILIRKEMINIHERTYKLKKRALRLQQIKQKEALNKEQQREQELRREQELIVSNA